MTRAFGTISTFSPRHIAGHVSFAHNPSHRPVLHLCKGWRLVGSRMAGPRVSQVDDGLFVRTFEFDAADMKVPGFSPDDVTIIVAETGERLVEPSWPDGELTVEEILQRGSKPGRGAVRTYEDALAFGYCAQEVVSLLFQDYLGRPCDGPAMKSWEGALTSGMSIVDLVESLILSGEYAERQLGIDSLPGGMFNNPLLYMADKQRMRELQDVSYDTPIHGLVTDLRPMAEGDNGDFVDAAFRTLLMRTADEAARRHFVHCLEQGWSRRNIAAGMLAAPEFDNKLLMSGFDALDVQTTNTGPSA